MVNMKRAKRYGIEAVKAAWYKKEKESVIMKRKLVAVLLLAAMSVTSLAGCGSDGGSGNDAESSRGG